MHQMNRINLLPQDISDKIAAGEVVDRPFSIVKELVENSIDAGAGSIVAEIASGGKTHIRISDNGEGISADESEKAFLRHATSKINTVEDLDNISTLGFRGEALASIAAVSRVEIITKTQDESMGTRLLVEGGHFIENKPTGCPDGTTIIVRDVFYNTPARLKFMKSDATEASLIIDFLSKMALAYPYIRFRMINNGVVLFSTRGNGNIYDSIITIYSKQIGNRLIEINHSDDDYHLISYISPPDTHRASRKGQVFFVNGRNISSKVLEKAVSAAYMERVPQGRFPLVFLFLKLPNNHLDVNIHPNKREVRFDDADKVLQFVSSALGKGLKSSKSLTDFKLESPFKTIKASSPRVDNKGENEKITEQVNIRDLLSTRRRAEHEQSQVSENQISYEQQSEDTHFSYEQQSADTHLQGSDSISLNELVPIGSVFATYIIAIDESKLYLIDQHAAHERIFYEKLLAQFDSQEKDTQMLISPIIVNVSPKAAGSADLWMDRLKNMGFDVEAFGIKTFRIRGIPSFMKFDESEKFLYSFIEDAGSETSGMSFEKLDKIIMKSCKSAIKANNLLNKDEMKSLLQELSAAKNPFSCPHGRPTMLSLSKGDVERMFKR